MVSLQDFLLTLGASRPKITNRFFWPLYDQMVLLTGVRPKPEFGPYEVRWVKILTRRDFVPLRQWSRKFSSRILYLFWATHSQKLVKFGILQDFLPILGAPWPKIGKIWKLAIFDGTLVKKTDTHFGRPTDKNYDSVSFTGVRPNGSNF